MKKLILALLVSTTLLPTGCTTTGSPGSPGTNTVDTIKLTQVRAALEPVGASAIRRVLARSPQHRAEIATYMQAVANVFCQMSANKNFDPLYLVEQADKIAAPKLSDQTVIDGKNVVIAIYKIYYAGRFTAELPPDQWADQLAQLICNSVTQGLKDAGAL